MSDYLKLINTTENAKRFPNNCFCFSDEDIEYAIDIMNRIGIHRVLIQQEVKNRIFCGFITYELIFEFFFNNYYATNMKLFENVKIRELNFCKKSFIRINKEDTIISCLLCFERNKISVMPVMNGEECFGFIYLKDFIYLWHYEKEIEVLLTYYLIISIIINYS